MRKDDKWLSTHFGQLVRRYAGKAVAVVRGRVVAVGSSEYEVERKAKKLYPNSQPSVMKIPKPKELVCALSIRIQHTVGSTFRLFR